MKWKTLDTEQIFKSGFVTVDKQKCELSDGRVMPGYYVMHFADWVNVVPVTEDRQVLVIKQYRHATGLIHWEVPGGAVDRGEDPTAAAQRELKEETGFTSGRLIKLSENFPNPAIQDNKIHTYLALDCTHHGPQQLDPYEEVELFKLGLDEFLKWVEHGKFNHTIVLASIYQAIAYMKQNGML